MKKMDKSFSIIDACDKVSKTSIYVLVFLLPVLFLPWTANVLDFNKQAILVLLVFISVFAWMLKVLISGRLSFNLSVVHIPVILLFLIYIASNIFSLSRYGSFWGWPQITSESTLSILGLTLLYFLIVNVFKLKEVFYLVISLIASSSLVMLYGFLQVLGKFVLPIGFTKAISFNTIGGVNSLGVFAAVILPLIITFLVTTKDKRLRIFSLISTLLAAALLLVINFQIAWWLVIIGAALIIALGTQKRGVFDSRWLVLPMFFLAVALLFAFFKFQIPGVPDRSIDVYLNNKASFDIATQSLKQSPLIGSGPGTFSYIFSRFKDIGFNQSIFWNLNFDWASSRVLTLLASLGVLGGLVSLALILFLIYHGIRFFFSKTVQELEGEEFSVILGIGLFASFLTATVGFFLYRSSLSLDFVYFLLIACFVSLFSPFKKEIILKPSSLTTLGITFAFTLIFIFGLGVIILEGQRYFSAMSYLEGIKSWQQRTEAETLEELQDKTNQTLVNLRKAIDLSPGVDLYWREISQVYIQSINEVAARTDLSQPEVFQLVQGYISSSVNAVRSATDVNPNNVANWSVRGDVYQSLIGLVGGTKDWAVDAYNKTLELEPTNPIYPTQAGISILVYLGQEDAENEEELLEEAREFFEKAIELKSDYAAAYFQLAMVYQLQGKEEEMVEQLEKTKSIAPNDVGLAFQLGLLYYQLEDFERAKVELERAVLLNNDYANALYFLGLVYDELGEKENAIAAFEKILSNNPDNELVIKILGNLRAGKRALAGIAEQEPPTVPIEEEYPEEE